ncbi:hypothetical protein ACH5RR_035727 [Cinchona calisaya]|uniref:F-box domain-containing protein n=1 Tax=Cinchona calisaya TaxID=153742 RepID=A0ABD2Y291_9GENT
MDLKACKISRMMMDSSSSSSLSDVTSKIPDEILIDILSRLSMKEAARTSVVSHRWENLGKFYGGCLDFDDLGNSKMLLYECTGKRDVRVERRSTTIDSWIRFAAAKRVRRLELDLSSLFSSENVKELEEIYSFPMDQLLSGELNLKLLTSLRLTAINVVGGGGSGDLRLKHLEIMRCLELERLEVSGARSLASFKYEVWYAAVEREGLPLIT